LPHLGTKLPYYHSQADPCCMGCCW